MSQDESYERLQLASINAKLKEVEQDNKELNQIIKNLSNQVISQEKSINSQEKVIGKVLDSVMSMTKTTKDFRKLEETFNQSIVKQVSMVAQMEKSDTFTNALDDRIKASREINKKVESDLYTFMNALDDRVQTLDKRIETSKEINKGVEDDLIKKINASNNKTMELENNVIKKINASNNKIMELENNVMNQLNSSFDKMKLVENDLTTQLNTSINKTIKLEANFNDKIDSIEKKHENLNLSFLDKVESDIKLTERNISNHSKKINENKAEILKRLSENMNSINISMEKQTNYYNQEFEKRDSKINENKVEILKTLSENMNSINISMEKQSNYYNQEFEKRDLKINENQTEILKTLSENMDTINTNMEKQTSCYNEELEKRDLKINENQTGILKTLSENMNAINTSMEKQTNCYNEELEKRDSKLEKYHNEQDIILSNIKLDISNLKNRIKTMDESLHSNEDAITTLDDEFKESLDAYSGIIEDLMDDFKVVSDHQTDHHNSILKLKTIQDTQDKDLKNTISDLDAQIRMTEEQNEAAFLNNNEISTKLDSLSNKLGSLNDQTDMHSTLIDMINESSPLISPNNEYKEHIDLLQKGLVKIQLKLKGVVEKASMDGLDKIRELLEKYSDDKGIDQYNSNHYILIELCNHIIILRKSNNNITELSCLPLVPVLMRIAENYQSHTSVISSTLKVIKMISVNSDVRQELLSFNIVEILSNIIKFSCTNKILQLLGFEIVQNFFPSRSANMAKQWSVMCPFLINSMKAHEGITELEMKSCLLVKSLSANSDSSRSLCHQGICNILAKLVENKDRELEKVTFAAANALATHPDNQKYLSKAGL